MFRPYFSGLLVLLKIFWIVLTVRVVTESKINPPEGEHTPKVTDESRWGDLRKTRLNMVAYNRDHREQVSWHFDGLGV